jgi:hypothetical protein
MLYTLTRRITGLLGTLSAIKTKLDRIFTQKDNLDIRTICLDSPHHRFDSLIGNTIIPV